MFKAPLFHDAIGAVDTNAVNYRMRYILPSECVGLNLNRIMHFTSFTQKPHIYEGKSKIT